MNVDQVVASAGDGNLRDGGDASLEFRSYLLEVPSESLFSYARHCLENPLNYSYRSLCSPGLPNRFL